MQRRSLFTLVPAALFIALSGCGRPSPLSPTPTAGPGSSPSGGVAAPAIAALVGVAGTVQDRAWRNLPAARVEVLDGPQAGLSAGVDARGQFLLSGAFDETTRFRATAAGHRDVTLGMPARCPQCNPNWWIHFSLESLEPAADLSGEYAVTFTADPACTQIPEAMRSRTYPATVRQSDADLASQFSLALRGGTFLPGYDRVTLGVAGEHFAMPLGDFHGTPGIAEEVAPHVYLAFEGAVNGSLAALASGTITASLDGVVSYCELSGPAGAHYGCAWATPVSKALCSSSRHGVVLRRSSVTAR